MYIDGNGRRPDAIPGGDGVASADRLGVGWYAEQVATGVARRWVTIGERLTRLVAARLGRNIH
jgi:hypothetical protein